MPPATCAVPSTKRISDWNTNSGMIAGRARHPPRSDPRVHADRVRDIANNEAGDQHRDQQRTRPARAAAGGTGNNAGKSGSPRSSMRNAGRCDCWKSGVHDWRLVSATSTRMSSNDERFSSKARMRMPRRIRPSIRSAWRVVVAGETEDHLLAGDPQIVHGGLRMQAMRRPPRGGRAGVAVSVRSVLPSWWRTSLDGAGGQQFSAVHHAERGAHFRELAEDVGADENRGAGVGQLAQRVAQDRGAPADRVRSPVRQG